MMESSPIIRQEVIDEFKKIGSFDYECIRRVEAKWNELLASARDPANLI
jgi:hypothetical protein